MKSAIGIISLLLVITLCLSNVNDLRKADVENNIVLEDDFIEEVDESGVEFDVFDSLEDFTLYLSKVDTGEGVSNLASLEKYYLPTGLPDDYKLYKITSGIVNIGFWYLPEDELNNPDSIRRAEAQERYFLFISPRQTTNEDVLQYQFGYEEDELINNKYYIVEYMPNVIVWIENNAKFELYIPKDSVDLYINEETLIDLCALEVVNVE